ncbi:hypothetical protein COI75_16045 [Bacillus cereus]|nr:hypothetical protein COI75_16045 [Bacillus cereus]
MLKYMFNKRVLFYLLQFLSLNAFFMVLEQKIQHIQDKKAYYVSRIKSNTRNYQKDPTPDYFQAVREKKKEMKHSPRSKRLSCNWTTHIKSF